MKGGEERVPPPLEAVAASVAPARRRSSTVRGPVPPAPDGGRYL